MRRLSFVLATIGIFSFACGCSTGPRIYQVKGTVNFEGKPVPAGVIYFDPDTEKGNDGPQGYAYIKDGVYDTKGKGGQGVAGKAYIARIRGFDGKPANELPMGQSLFLEYKKAIDFPLQDSTQEFQIAAQ